MAEDLQVERSLVEQILEATFADLESNAKFDVDTILTIRQLAQDGNLNKVAAVTDALTRGSGQPVAP